MRTSKLLLSDIGLFTGVSLDKSPGDSLLFKQSALRGVYALTVHLAIAFMLQSQPDPTVVDGDHYLDVRSPTAYSLTLPVLSRGDRSKY